MIRDVLVKVTIILRGYDYEQVLTVMRALEGREKQYAVEITLNSPDVFETIRKISATFGKKFLIGAGTVVNLQEAKEAIAAGAKFILSPVVIEKEILDVCKANQVLSVSAALTPTEVWYAYKAGSDAIKIFPATSVGVNYFQALKAPLGDIPLMAVGGISKANAKAFLGKGADFVGISSGIFEKADVVSKNVAALRKSLEDFESSLH